MTDVPTACYVPTGRKGPRGGEVVESTRLAAAEWYSDGQHGGVVSALIARAVEQEPALTPMEVSRVTVELFRVVPVAELEVVTERVREGKRIQTSEVRVYGRDIELARGLVQRLRTTELALPAVISEGIVKPPGPDGIPDTSFANTMPFHPDNPVSFGQRAVTMRQVHGAFSEPGPATVWLRFTAALVEGEAMTATQRAILASDFSNGLSRLAEPHEWLFMNSDLSVHLARPPVGEWVGLDGESVWSRRGRGVATSHLFDADGPIGRATQTLFLDRAPTA